MIILPIDSKIPIPADVATCPICGAGIYAQVTRVEAIEDGGLRAAREGTFGHCRHEPETPGVEWQRFFAGHYATHGWAWGRAEETVFEWLSTHYRFVVQNSTRENSPETPIL